MHKALDRVRQYVAAQLGEADASKHALLWVTGEPCPGHTRPHTHPCPETSTVHLPGIGYLNGAHRW